MNPLNPVSHLHKLKRESPDCLQNKKSDNYLAYQYLCQSPSEGGRNLIPYQGQPWLGCRVAATGYSRTAALSVTPPLSALILLSEKRQNVQGCTGLDFKIHTLVTVHYRNT